MQYLNTHPDTRLHSGLRSIRIKYLLLVPLALLAVFELSSTQLILLALAFALGLALVERISELTRARPPINAAIRNLNSFDGGTFTAEQATSRPRGGVKIVHDGGSFERAHLTGGSPKR